MFDLTPVNHDVVYESESTIGYRHFDASGIAPRFGFGHGLGYASFALEDLTVQSVSGVGARIGVTVRNIAKRPGKEVIQVYVQAPQGVGSGTRELKAFTPVWLEPGAARRVELELDERAFRHWHAGRGWTVAAGAYDVSVGRSHQDVQLRGSIHV